MTESKQLSNEELNQIKQRWSDTPLVDRLVLDVLMLLDHIAWLTKERDVWDERWLRKVERIQGERDLLRKRVETLRNAIGKIPTWRAVLDNDDKLAKGNHD